VTGSRRHDSTRLDSAPVVSLAETPPRTRTEPGLVARPVPRVGGSLRWDSSSLLLPLRPRVTADGRSNPSGGGGGTAPARPIEPKPGATRRAPWQQVRVRRLRSRRGGVCPPLLFSCVSERSIARVAGSIQQRVGQRNRWSSCPISLRSVGFLARDLGWEFRGGGCVRVPGRLGWAAAGWRFSGIILGTYFEFAASVA
jgi:hypothetical protein